MSPDRDNAGASIRDPQTWNAYSYVRNDPLRYTDRTGRNVDNTCSGADGPNCGGDGDWDPPFMPGDDSGATLCDPGDQFWSDSGCVGAPSPAPTPAPVAQVNCEALTASVGISGFNYSIASELWNDGSLSNYKDDPTAAVIAALATITYQGESEFGTNLRNNNVGNGRVAIGPFQIQYPSLWNSITTNPQNVFGTNLKAGQTFNGNMDANITAGISILKYPYTQYGDNAAGKYIGVNIKGRNPPVDVRQKQFDKYKNALVNLFENQQCFPHN